MANVDFREEVVNVALAELLEQRGMISVPETIRRSVARHTRDLPDILVGDFWGIRIVIEGRFEASRRSRDSLLRDAKQRVEDGISPVCLAVLYPPNLRSAESYPKLKRNLENAPLRIRVISESSDGDWTEGQVDEIVDALRRSYELLVSEDVVIASVGDLEEAIDAASETFLYTRTLKDRFRTVLGIPAENEQKDEERTPRIDSDFKVCRIASLTLVNAMIFQQVLAARNRSVKSVKRTTEGKNIAEELLQAWTFILEEIDYVPIFATATDVVRELIGMPDSDRAL